MAISGLKNLANIIRQKFFGQGEPETFKTELALSLSHLPTNAMATAPKSRSDR